MMKQVVVSIGLIGEKFVAPSRGVAARHETSLACERSVEDQVALVLH